MRTAGRIVRRGLGLETRSLASGAGPGAKALAELYPAAVGHHEMWQRARIVVGWIDLLSMQYPYHSMYPRRLPDSGQR